MDQRKIMMITQRIALIDPPINTYQLSINPKAYNRITILNKLRDIMVSAISTQKFVSLLGDLDRLLTDPKVIKTAEFHVFKACVELCMFKYDNALSTLQEAYKAKAEPLEMLRDVQQMVASHVKPEKRTKENQLLFKDISVRKPRNDPYTKAYKQDRALLHIVDKLCLYIGGKAKPEWDTEEEDQAPAFSQVQTQQQPQQLVENQNVTRKVPATAIFKTTAKVRLPSKDEVDQHIMNKTGISSQYGQSTTKSVAQSKVAKQPKEAAPPKPTAQLKVAQMQKEHAIQVSKPMFQVTDYGVSQSGASQVGQSQTKQVGSPQVQQPPPMRPQDQIPPRRQVVAPAQLPGDIIQQLHEMQNEEPQQVVQRKPTAIYVPKVLENQDQNDEFAALMHQAEKQLENYQDIPVPQEVQQLVKFDQDGFPVHEQQPPSTTDDFDTEEVECEYREELAQSINKLRKSMKVGEQAEYQNIFDVEGADADYLRF